MAPIRYCSTVRQSHQLRFESTTAQYGTQLVLWGQAVPAIITWSLATAVIGLYRSVLFPTEGLVEEFVSVSFVRFACWCQHGVFFFLKSYWMLYCCFPAWLPVCSVLNSAELLWRATASTGNRSPAYLLRSRYAAQRTWWGLPHRLKWNLLAPLAWRRRNAADTYPVEIGRNGQMLQPVFRFLRGYINWIFFILIYWSTFWKLFHKEWIRF